MYYINLIFGGDKDPAWYQMVARAAAMFVIAVAITRAIGMRIFSRKTVMDDIVTVMLGAILSRGITGSVPFFYAVAAGTMLIIIHRVFAFLCIKSRLAERLIKGEPKILYENGTFNRKNLVLCMLTEADVMESMRLQTNKNDLGIIEQAQMENNGSISFVVKQGS